MKFLKNARFLHDICQKNIFAELEGGGQMSPSSPFPTPTVTNNQKSSLISHVGLML